MKMMVLVQGTWLVGIADWRGCLLDKWQQYGWRKQGYRTKLVPR